MKLKLKSDKRSQLLNAASKFNGEVLNGSLLLHDCINDLVNGKLDKKKLDKVMECEHNADRAKEDYINLLYKDQRALPFLVEDRYRLIKYLDIVSDSSEELAMGLKVYPFELFDDIKEDYIDIPWSNIIGMRDILIHQYFGVDLELTWRVIKDDIPELKKQIISIKEKL